MVAVPVFPRAKVRVSSAFERSALTSSGFVFPHQRHLQPVLVLEAGNLGEYPIQVYDSRSGGALEHSHLEFLRFLRSFYLFIQPGGVPAFVAGWTYGTALAPVVALPATAWQVPAREGGVSGVGKDARRTNDRP
jgi:hypothetical protein